MAEPAAVILGCSAGRLSADERAFFRELGPLGFILFQRNCDDEDQVRRLTRDLRESVGRNAPILIDQEGGRVARLKPPRWRALPAAGSLGALHADDPKRAAEAARCVGRLTAFDLEPLGITVNCAPVVDVTGPEAHATAIGDRAYGHDPTVVGFLARAYVDGLMAGGVLPVVKHIPGHGRANADSHFELPVVDADDAALDGFDLAPFRALSHAPLAMTAHVLYPAWDGDLPATLSAAVIGNVIRGRCGFDGLLLSDDLSMKALGGTLRDRASGALKAGCDVALHCNGDMAEMQEVALGVTPLSPAGSARWGRAGELRRTPDDERAEDCAARLARLMTS